ncbi:hypothetical protein Cfor_10883, partial [Coptotermes formosanus]
GRDEEEQRSFEGLRYTNNTNPFLNEFQKEFRTVIENSKRLKGCAKNVSQGDEGEPSCQNIGFSGIPVLLSYAVNIMISEGVSMEPYLATLLLGVVKILFETAAGFVQNRQVH